MTGLEALIKRKVKKSPYKEEMGNKLFSASFP
jgi:hypothetical protein